jgi:N-acetylglucosaminyl-diphospho-decaprenol L-rhamnosyltransferase
MSGRPHASNAGGIRTVAQPGHPGASAINTNCDDLPAACPSCQQGVGSLTQRARRFAPACKTLSPNVSAIVPNGPQLSSAGDVIKRKPPTLHDVAVVIVLYNSADEIEKCLDSVPAEVAVMVVDNASTDDGAARARQVRPDATVLQSRRNLGFGGGCNLGWRATNRPFVAFVNPDVRLRGDVLSVLLDRLAGLQNFVVGPCLVDGHGVPRRCKRRPSALADVLGLLPASARWAPEGWDGKLNPKDPVHVNGGPVASVEGACFLVRRSELAAIGGFDEDFFLYCEEESIALRLAGLRGGALYEPRAIADHSGAASTSRVGTLATRHLHRSRVIFYRKRDGALRGELTGLLLIFAVLLATPSAVVNTLLRRRRHTTLAQQRHVLAGLWAGMTAPLHSEVSYRSSGTRLVITDGKRCA